MKSSNKTMGLMIVEQLRISRSSTSNNPDVLASQAAIHFARR
jgi:hypothetical protein